MCTSKNQKNNNYKKAQAGKEWVNVLPKSSQARKGSHHYHHMYTTACTYLHWGHCVVAGFAEKEECVSASDCGDHMNCTGSHGDETCQCLPGFAVRLDRSCGEIIIIIHPLAAGVVGAPQIISQPVSSIFLCSPLPSFANYRPVHSLMLSSHLF